MKNLYEWTSVRAKRKDGSPSSI